MGSMRSAYACCLPRGNRIGLRLFLTPFFAPIRKFLKKTVEAHRLRNG
jgi:hypothetical protein